jgi:hypothetical protein
MSLTSSPNNSSFTSHRKLVHPVTAARDMIKGTTCIFRFSELGLRYKTGNRDEAKENSHVFMN